MSTSYSTGYTTPTYLIVIPIVSSIFILIVLLSILGRSRANLQYATTSPNPRNYLSLDQWERKVGSEVEERNAQLVATTLGNQVWFSRYIYGGRPAQWTLFVNDTKFELQRVDYAGDYKYDSGPSTVMLEEERANLAELQDPETDNYCMCLIGWTKMDPQQVWSVFQDCQRQYGKETLPAGRCAAFLQSFTERVIKTRAIDGRWFTENITALFRPNAALPRPPPALIRLRIQSQQDMSSREADNQEITSALTQRIALNQQLLNQQIPSTVMHNPPSYAQATWVSPPSTLRKSAAQHHHAAHAHNSANAAMVAAAASSSSASAAASAGASAGTTGGGSSGGGC